MDSPHLSRRLGDLKAAAVLEQLVQGVTGLATGRRLACGARVLAAAGVQLVPDPGRRRPRCAASRLELRHSRDAVGPARLPARAVVLDAELPLSTAALTLPGGARAGRAARAIAERCALESVRALLAARAQVPAPAPEPDATPDPDHGLDGTW